MQNNMPHFKNYGLMAGAAMVLAATLIAPPAWAERGEGDGGGTIFLQPRGGGLQLTPGLLNYGNYGNNPAPATNNQITGTPPADDDPSDPFEIISRPAILLPPSFFARQMKMYQRQMDNLEKIGMVDSQSYQAAAMGYQRALSGYNRAMDALEEDDRF